MKFLKSGLILLAIAFFAFACSQTNTTTNSGVSGNAANNPAVVAANSNQQQQTTSATVDELAAARKTYSEVCIKCHKEGGIGGVSEFDGKKIKAPNFTSERMIKDNDADWIDAIQNGIKDEGMPAFKDRLSDQEIKDLVKMIRKDFQKK
jgi:mono/diheme cytochrome c family protein